MLTDDDNLEKKSDLLKDHTPEEVEEIMENASDHGLGLDEAQEVKDLAEELGVDTDDAAEINEAM